MVTGEDLDGQGRHEVIVAPGPSAAAPAQVKGFTYSGSWVPSSLDFQAFASNYGARVAADAYY